MGDGQPSGEDTQQGSRLHGQASHGWLRGLAARWQAMQVR